jgi:hypothetical protein
MFVQMTAMSTRKYHVRLILLIQTCWLVFKIGDIVNGVVLCVAHPFYIG